MPDRFLDHPGPLAFAHRGGAAHCPENSWRAFRHAVGLGYRYLETDAQATADGVLLAFHDRTLNRVTDRSGRIARMAHRDVAAARIGGTEPIPLLEDLLGAWPDVRFNIDLKDAAAVRPLAEVLRRTAAWNRVCVVSFSASRLREARQAFDRQVCMAATPFGAMTVQLTGAWHRHGSHPGRRQGRPQRARWAVRAGESRGLQTLQCTRGPDGPAGRPGTSLAERLARLGVRCAQVPAALATSAFICRAHVLGLQVHAWTVNDRGTMNSLLDMGADGIMTDDVVALRDVLVARGQWHPRQVA